MEGILANPGRDRVEVSWMVTLRGFWHRAQRVLKSRQSRRLRVRESLSLGDHRFLAVIEFDRQEFLVGGSGSSLSLLARVQEGKVITGPPLAADTRIV
jgi:flagellar biogenesis protein FliO